MNTIFASRQSRVAVGAAAATAVLVSVALFGIARASAGDDPIQSKQISSAFGRTQSETDQLPEFLTSGRQALDEVEPASSRLLAEDDGVKYWIAEGTASNYCMVILLPGKGEFAATTCKQGAGILQSGIYLQVADPTHTLRAYLVPPGYSGESPALRSNGELLLGDSSGRADELHLVSDDGAHDIVFPALEATTSEDGD
jgi:hypothetical protein